MGEAAAKPPRPRRRLSLGKRLGFTCLTLVVLFGVPEVAFRVREWTRQRRKPRLPLQPDPYRIMSLIPNASYDRPEQNRRMTINSLGFRGPDLGEKDKPRIYCAGGSTTFGLYASSNETTWPHKLQVLLGERGHAVDVINGGAPGWTSRTSTTNLELRGWVQDVDLLVIYHGWNDVISNHEQRYWDDSQVDDVEQLYRPRPVGVLEHSALFRFIQSRVNKLESREELVHKRDALSEEGVAAFERNLRRLIRRAGEEGARVLLCTFPTCLRETEAASQEAGVPELDEWYGEMSPLTYPHLWGGLRRYNEVVRAVGADTSTPVVDLEQVFPKDTRFYVTPMHHSDEGEALVARLVGERVLELDLLPR